MCEPSKLGAQAGARFSSEAPEKTFAEPELIEPLSGLVRPLALGLVCLFTTSAIFTWQVLRRSILPFRTAATPCVRLTQELRATLVGRANSMVILVKLPVVVRTQARR